MLLRDLTKVYISEYEEIEDHGEVEKKWKYKGKVLTVSEVNTIKVKELNNTLVIKLLEENNKGIAFLNLQQDVNELDRKSTGEIDYEIYKCRTDKPCNIKKGDGISIEDISKKKEFVPEYRVLDINKIGKTYVYRMEKIN